MLSVGQIVFPRKELGKIRSASFPELVQSNLSKSLSWLHKAASMSQEFCFLGSGEEECTQKEISSIAGEGSTKASVCLSPCLPNLISCKQPVPSLTFTQMVRIMLFWQPHARLPSWWVLDSF